MRYHCAIHDEDLDQPFDVAASGHLDCARAGKITMIGVEAQPEPPMDQPTLNWEETIRRRDQAVAAVDDNADDRWKAAADAAIALIAETRYEFTTDPVWELLDHWEIPPPREPRAMGGRILDAAAAGILIFTDRHDTSVIPRGHGRTIRIYRRGPNA